MPGWREGESGTEILGCVHEIMRNGTNRRLVEQDAIATDTLTHQKFDGGTQRKGLEKEPE